MGDLSGLMVGYADFSMAVKLQNLILGKSNEGLSPGDEHWYSNGNLQTLYLGNNTLLQSIDVRNCTGLGTGEQTTVDISGCTNIKTVLFDGTNITGLTLPDGGVLETLHLPGTITILKVLNQTGISDFPQIVFALMFMGEGQGPGRNREIKHSRQDHRQHDPAQKRPFRYQIQDRERNAPIDQHGKKFGGNKFVSTVKTSRDGPDGDHGEQDLSCQDQEKKSGKNRIFFDHFQ